MKNLSKTILVSFIVLLISCDNDQNNEEQSLFAQENIKWPSLADTPWPIYNHDVQNTNRSQFAGPELTPTNIEEITFGKLLYSSFTVDDAENLFMTDYSGVYSVNTLSMDISLLFQMPDFAYNYSTPIYTNDYDLINVNWSGNLVKNNIITGLNNFTVQLDDNVWINPLIDLNGNILVAGMNKLYKINNNGTIIWENDYEELWSGAISPDGSIIYFNDNTTIYAIDNETGNDLNSYSAKNIFYPTISNNGDLFFNDISDTSITCLKSDLSLKWKYLYGRDDGIELSWDSGTLDYDGNYYTVGETEQGDELLSFDYEGELRWRTSLIHDQRTALLSDVNKNVFVLGYSTNDADEAYLSNINQNGELIWSVELPYQMYESPLITEAEQIVIPALRSTVRNLLILE